MNLTSKSKAIDISEIIGQEHAKRAIEVAAVCKANVLLIGNPGAGKSMLADAYAGLLAIEILRVSVSDTVKTLRQKVNDMEGKDVLIIADDLPELKKDVLLYIKELSQERNIPVATTMLPCSCGYLGDARHQCLCTPAQIARYRSNLSGSILEIFDIHIQVPPVSIRDICNNLNGTAYITETTENVLSRVIPARERYQINQSNLKPCQDALDLLATASLKLGFSARSVARILNISRAIADLDNGAEIKSHHIAEAVQYRTLDRRV